MAPAKVITKMAEEQTGAAKKRGSMKSLPVRRTCEERDIIRKLAKNAGLSEARLMVTAALLLADFKTEEELRAAVHVGGLLWQSRAQAVMQVRRVGRQLESLREGIDPRTGAADLARLEGVLSEVATTLKLLGAAWNRR